MGVVKSNTDLIFSFHVTNKICIAIRVHRIITDFSEVLVRIFQVTCHKLFLPLEEMLRRF